MLTDMSDKYPCKSAFDRGFEVFGEVAAEAEPSAGALDHPSVRDEHDTVGRVRTLNDFDGPVAVSSKGHARVGPAYPPSAKTWRNQGYAERIEDRASGAPSRSWMSAAWIDDADEMALCVGDDVPLAAHDLLTGVESARTAASAGFRGLAVDHADRRTGLASILLSRRHDQGVIDRLPTSPPRQAWKYPCTVE